MNTQTQTLQNAEQLWFWFIYSRAVRNGILKTGGRATRRVCELVDVESLITKLYLCGKITDEQLSVMKKFGDKYRAPHQHIWAENRAADQWRSAMTTLGDAAYSHGWIEQ